MIEENNSKIYEGLFRLENNLTTGLPDNSNHRDFTFIRIKLPQKKLFFFDKFVNCIPIEMPKDFRIPPPKNKFERIDENPRIFKIKIEGQLCKKEWTNTFPDSFRAMMQYSYQKIRITKFLLMEEI